MTFDFPIDGAVLNPRQGVLTGGELRIEVRGRCDAPAQTPVLVNGTMARRQGSQFVAEVLLPPGQSAIHAVAGANGGEAAVRVVFHRDSFPRYRIAIDDNIFFLRDIAAQQPASLFDHFYLRGLRDLHQRYGTKFVLNLFFEDSRGGFTLDRFPARYRGEFADHADWLRLAFHARQEFPDRPYQDAPPEVLAADYDLVASEILRFAGEDAYSPTTVIHWAMVRPDAWKVLAERGSRLLSGTFVRSGGGNYTGDGHPFGGEPGTGDYDVNNCMDQDRSAWMSRNDLLLDFGSGLLFSKVEMFCNCTPPSLAASVLAPLLADPATSEVMDIITHEQYFWPEYKDYRPDHFARCEAAIKFCTEHGFQPVFFHQGIAGC